MITHKVYNSSETNKEYTHHLMQISHFTTNEKHNFKIKKTNFVIEQIYFHYRLNVYYLIPLFSTIALIRFKVGFALPLLDSYINLSMV
jgi:hypothetical protein